jgi:NNP family nitrate/nitrite transporter-like MFS transporter
MSKDLTGAFTVGFCVFAGLSIVGLIGIISVKTRWRTTWGAASGATV